jgi:hypothetical protein
MGRRFGRVARVAALLAAPGLFGCAVVDNYSWRAVDYNKEAEQAQEEVLLLNIIRASLRRPMQFTALQSVTGSASVAGSLNAGAAGTRQTPFLSLFPSFFNTPPTGVSTNAAISRIATSNISGNASLSGSATFTVPVLDTQEFYQGILTPIPLQSFDYYLQQNFPPQVLFDLFVLKIEVTRLDDGSCRKFTFQNSVRDDLQFGQFQAFIDYLIGSGLSTERVSAITPYGPPIPSPTSGSATHEDTAKILDAYSRVSAAGLDIRQEGSGANATYRVQKKNNVFRFCFAYPGGTPSDWIGRPNSSMFCGHFNRRLQARLADSQSEGGLECVPRRGGTRPTAVAGSQDGARAPDDDYDSRSQGLHESGVSEFRGIRLSPEFVKRIDRLQQAALEKNPGLPDDALFKAASFANGLVSFKVYTRSTEGILYYLGEITRRRLFTEFGDTSRTIQVKTQQRYGTFPLSECDNAENGASWEQKTDLVYLSRQRAGRSGAPGRYYCENLFVLDTDGAGGNPILTASYDGKYFGIPRDPNRHGRTLQVLELVKQLLAQNTSAKQLPATSVISVIGQ